MIAFLAAVIAYLVGSIPFAVIVSRAMGLPDPRSFGSGNPGATHVLRSGSKAAAILTLAGDALKGWLPVWVAIRMDLGDVVVAVVVLAAFLGHVFPVWLRFKGGKGVATAAGAILAADWRVGAAALVAWLGVAVATRYSSLASIVAAIIAPAAAYGWQGFGSLFAATCATCAVLLWRHEGNIRKLLRGEESRIGEKKAAT